MSRLGHPDAYETLQISPWPVPELTGVQWVEPLPQASYMGCINTPLGESKTPHLLQSSLLCLKPSSAATSS